MDPKSIEEDRRTRPAYEPLGVESELEVHIAEIGSSSAQSTGRVCETFPVIADTELDSMSVESLLEALPGLTERKRIPRLPPLRS